jgi:outer membrane protein TolC
MNVWTWLSNRGYYSSVTEFIGAMFVMAVLLTGCSINQQGEQEISVAWEGYKHGQAGASNNYAHIPAKQTTSTSTTTQSASQLESPNKLRDYLILALEHNPDIKRAEQFARAKAARIPQVTALPDPTLMTKILPEPVRTAEGDNYFILGVSQKFPVPEKLTRAGQIALEETRMYIAQWEQTRLRIIGEVKRAYFQIYIVDKTISITRENQDLLRSLIDAARGQVAAGKRRQEDVLRAQVELSNLESQLIELRQRRVAAEAMLNTLLNRNPTTPVPKPESFDIRQVEMKLEQLFAKAIKTNPELKRFERQIDRDKEAVALSRLAYWPDFTLGFEWMSMQPRDAFVPPINPQTGRRPAAPQLSEDGSDNWAIIFGLNVPIWFDKIEAGIREAKRKLSASMHEYTSAKNMVHFRIEDALAKVHAQQELAELFDSTIIPQAKQAYEVSRTGYVVGKSDFLDVIDNWQKWLVFTIQYHRAIGELERSVADLEQTIGLSLVEVESLQ